MTTDLSFVYFSPIESGLLELMQGGMDQGFLLSALEVVIVQQHICKFAILSPIPPDPLKHLLKLILL